MRTVSLFLVLCFSAGLLSAQQPERPFDRLLIPSVAREPIPGAFNSLWVTEVAGRNLDSEPLLFFFPVCPLFECDYFSVAPGGSFGIEPFAGSIHGTVVAFRGEQADEVIVSARVRDLSRALDTWGTEMPVVRESQVGSSEINLLNIPTSDRFRTMIRMYDFQTEGNEFVVRVYPLEDSLPIAEAVLPTQVLRDQFGVDQGIRFAVMGDLLLPSHPPERVRVTIGTTQPTKFWAFASVTNNETQHVTVVSPTRADAAE